MQTTFGVGNDQPVLNYFVNRDIPEDYKVLGYEWNMQDMTRLEVLTEDFLHTRYGYISHYNAGVKPTPGFWIEKTYNTFIRMIISHKHKFIFFKTRKICWI